MAKGFGEFLVAGGRITEEQLQEAGLMQQDDRISLPRALIALGCLTEDELLRAAAAYAGCPYVDLSNYVVNLHAIFVVPVQLVERYKVLPLQCIGRILVVATSDPFNAIAADELRWYTRLEVRWVVAAPDQIEAGIAKADEETEGHFFTSSGPALPA